MLPAETLLTLKVRGTEINSTTYIAAYTAHIIYYFLPWARRVILEFVWDAKFRLFLIFTHSITIENI